MHTSNRLLNLIIFQLLFLLKHLPQSYHKHTTSSSEATFGTNLWRLGENTRESWLLTLLLCFFRGTGIGHSESSQSELVPCCFMLSYGTLLCSSFCTMLMKEKSIFFGKKPTGQLPWRELLPAQCKKHGFSLPQSKFYTDGCKIEYYSK